MGKRKKPIVYGHWDSGPDLNPDWNDDSTDRTLALPLTGIVRLHHHGGILTIYYRDGRELNLGCVLDDYTSNNTPSSLPRMEAFMRAHGIPLTVPRQDD
ncbi:MAG: hypothetical protein OXF79_02180 [Chloroflexi bacterium]|nr:hypothetical protein [Chloroflexota bacterium]